MPRVSDLSRLFKLLSDPTRLRLLRLLAEQELSVMELAEATQLAQSRISNHLKLLRDEELLQERREGAWRYYRIDADRLPEGVKPLWDSVREAIAEDREAEADWVRLEGVLARRTMRNGRFFESIADQWDMIHEELFGDTIARAVLRTFVPAGLTVVDVGCGTGYGLELLGGRPGRLIGIDASEAMLGVARRKVAALGLGNVELRRGDAHDPPLARGEADLVLLVMVMHHLERPFEALAAAGRALKSGGKVILADFAEHQETWLRELMQHRWLGFRRADVEAALAEAGMGLESWSTLPGRTWTAPDNRKVRVPDGFVAVAMHQAAE